jgi:hypothetical protein
VRPRAPAHMPARFAGRERVLMIAGSSEVITPFQPPDDQLRGLAALASRQRPSLPVHAFRLG